MVKMPHIGIFSTTLLSLRICTIALILVTSSSCEHKELCFNHAHTAEVNVIYDWSYAPDADPETMILYFFSKDKGTEDRYDFSDVTGGTITQFAGDYTVACFNGETENTRFTTVDEIGYGDNAGRHFALTTASTELLSRLTSINANARNKAPRSADSQDQRIATEPDKLWIDGNTNITLLEAISTNQTIILFPKQAYCTYTVKVLNVENIERVAEVSATLSGLAGGIIPLSADLTDELVTIPFGMEINNDDANDNTFYGNFLTFGHCPDNAQNTHTLTIYTVMTNGEKYYFNIDVTSQVENAPDQRNVLIVVDGLALPEPTQSDSGFAITVDSWQTVYIDVTME